MEQTMSDMPRLRPYARQGKAYYDELKAYFREIQHDLKADAERMKRENGGKFVVLHLLQLALKYELNVKATADCLEDLRFLPCGAYDRIKECGFRPMIELRKLWDEQQGKTAVQDAFERATVKEPR
jgi:hypothetical protein